MNEDLKKALKCAFSKTKEGMAFFARSVSFISMNMPCEWNRKQFIPFLADWINFNDKFVTSVISSQITTLGVRSEGIAFITPLIAVILISQNTTATLFIEQGVRKFKKDKTLKKFLEALSKSNFDDVRSFVPKVIDVVEDDDFRDEMLMKLATDKSFCVRKSVLLSLKKQKLSTTQKIAFKMADDPSLNIRSYLIEVTSSFPFWLDKIVSHLEGDSSWQVRASIASCLLNCDDTESAFSVINRIIYDHSWEVKLVALKVFACFLRKNSDVTINNFDELISYFIIIMKGLYSNFIKKATIDVFIEILKKEIHNFDEKKWIAFVDIVLANKQAAIKIHFFETIARESFKEIIPAIEDRFMMQVDMLAIVRNLVLREKWAEHLNIFADFFTSEAIYESIKRAGKILVKDYSFRIRDIACDFMATQSVKGDKTIIPAVIDDFVSSPCFRDRQIAISIFGKIYDKSEDEKIKKMVFQNIEVLSKDPVNNVSLMANDFIKSKQNVDATL